MFCDTKQVVELDGNHEHVNAKPKQGHNRAKRHEGVGTGGSSRFCSFTSYLYLPEYFCEIFGAEYETNQKGARFGNGERMTKI